MVTIVVTKARKRTIMSFYLTNNKVTSMPAPTHFDKDNNLIEIFFCVVNLL